MFNKLNNPNLYTKTNVTPGIFSHNFVAQLYRVMQLQCATMHVAHCNKSHKQMKQTWLLAASYDSDDDIVAIRLIQLNKLRI